jgi:hemolysin-activating ACP:hemolysin acyltransferase
MEQSRICAAAPVWTLRASTDLDPETAFARAVAHLMTHPAFARAPFGHVARNLAGQVNRGHYAFVVEGARTCGFAGWACVEEPVAEAWLAGTRGFDDAAARRGDCVVLNFWQADAPEISRLLMAHLARRLPTARRVYARRHYSDGRVRPVRLKLTSETIEEASRRVPLFA